jgi:hopanoid biosynthesis associated protein HpnK
VRRLIINADDFAMTAGINRGIEQACRGGLVRSTTLMASGAAFDDAVAVARRTPSLDVGCHIVLIGGKPILPAIQLPSLVAQVGGGNKNDSAQFRSSMIHFGRAAVGGKLAAEEIKAEVRAQILRLQDAGIWLSHVDTHKHTHIFPAVLAPLLEAARDCGIRAIRSPFTPLRLLAAQLFRLRQWSRSTQVALLRVFHGDFERELKRTGVRAPDGAFGIVSTGSLTSATFGAIAAAIPEGTWELICHPGYSDAALDQVATRLRKSRETELEVLCSEQARESLARHGVEIISYRDFLET